MSPLRDRTVIVEILLGCAGILAVLFMGGGWTVVILLGVVAIAAVFATRIRRSVAARQPRRSTDRHR